MTQRAHLVVGLLFTLLLSACVTTLDLTFGSAERAAVREEAPSPAEIELEHHPSARTFWIGSSIDVLLSLAGAEAAWSITGDGDSRAQKVVPWAVYSALAALMVADVAVNAVRLSEAP